MPWNLTTTRSTGFTVTAAVWNDELVENMAFLREVNYTAFTSDVPVSATAVGSANQIVTSSAITYEEVPHMLEFYVPCFTAGAGQLRLIVRDGSTVKGTLARIAGGSTQSPIGVLGYRFTPTAGSHTYNIAGWVGAAGTWTLEAGTGGSAGDSGSDVAGFLRIFRVPT